MAINWKNFEQNNKAIAFNPIQDGGGPKKPPPPAPPLRYQFFLCNFYKHSN